MNKQDLAILIQTMEAQRKGGGFSFDVMPHVAQTMQKMTSIYNFMEDDDFLAIKPKENLCEAKPSEGKATK